MPHGHRLESRATLLAGRMRLASQGLRHAVAAEGARVPFTERLPHSEAVAWWRLHRYDEFGQRAAQLLTPDQMLDLDLALSQPAEPTGLMGEEEGTA